jgi:sulfonate transport system substrate-binding protein
MPGMHTRSRIPRPLRALGMTGATATLALTAVACGSATAEPNADAVRENGSVDLSKVTLRVGDQKGGSHALLTAAGGLNDTPYKVRWSEFTSGPALLEAVNSGAVDIGGVGNTPPLFAAAAGSDITAVYSNTTTGSVDNILVPKGSPIDSVEDLKGKTVALTEGSSANYHLLAQLQRHGLSYDDVEVHDLEPPDALAAFTSGNVDAWAIWDPYAAQAELQYGAEQIANGKGVTNGFNFQMASNESLASRATRAAIEDYIGRIAAAQRWSQQHPGEWARAWAKDTGLPVAVTEKAVHRRFLTPMVIDQGVVASEQHIADAFAEAGLIPERIDVDRWFSSEFSEVVTRSGGKASSQQRRQSREGRAS